MLEDLINFALSPLVTCNVMVWWLQCDNYRFNLVCSIPPWLSLQYIYLYTENLG